MLRNQIMPAVYSKLSQFLWLFIPPILVFISLTYLASLYQQDINSWLNHNPSLIFIGIIFSSVITLLFGQSRLFYIGLILMFYMPLVKEFFSGYDLFSQLRLGASILIINLFMFSQDKGFAAYNQIKTGIVLSVTLVGAWLIYVILPSSTNEVLSQIISVFSPFIPNQFIISHPITFLITTLLMIVSLIRLIWVSDNTHNTLFFILLLTIYIHQTDNSATTQISVVFILLLIAYSVIKDSRTMAFKDELTSIPSRRSLMQYVQTLGRKYTVVMSDIDHFKKFNDTHGHDVGDEVLKLVASKLNKVAGGGKTFRFGGEEFVIIFPRKTPQEVQVFIEQIRLVIADYDIALRAKPRPQKPPKNKTAKAQKAAIVKVTTSFGIAQRTKGTSSFEDVMKQADIALYAAKKAGRNCIKVAKQ